MTRRGRLAASPPVEVSAKIPIVRNFWLRVGAVCFAPIDFLCVGRIDELDTLNRILSD